MPIRGRRSRRFTVEDSTVEYRRHSALSFLGGAPKVSPLVNLSLGGLQFVSEDLYDVGQRLDLKVILPIAFRAMAVRGEVIWAKRITDRASFRTGVRFLDPSAEDVAFLRSMEERCWSVPEDRKREMEAVIARRFPVHAEPQTEGQPARIYDDVLEEPPAPARAPAAEPAAPEAPEPAEAESPAAAPPLEGETPLIEPAPEEAAAEPEETPPPLPLEPAAAAETPAEAPPEEAEAEPEPAPAAPAHIPLYDLIAGIEARPDARFFLQGVPKAEIVLPGITDRDCFALEIHDNTMRQSGTPSFDRGDVVVFSPNVPARSGDLAFVATSESGVFRQIFFDANNIVRLHPLNSWYPEQCFHRGEVQGLWKLVGKFESYLGK